MHWLNNFFEDLTNSSNPRYCGGPVQSQTYLTINQQEEKQFSQQRVFDEWAKADRDRREQMGLWVSEHGR
jgi:hypothetical protein